MAFFDELCSMILIIARKWINQANKREKQKKCPQFILKKN